jgi:hypothetical protein
MFLTVAPADAGVQLIRLDSGVRRNDKLETSADQVNPHRLQRIKH